MQPRLDPLEAVLASNLEFLNHQATGSANVQKQARLSLAKEAAAEDRVRHDYSGRFPMELLQNAHDACAEVDHVGAVHFVLTPTALLVANEGVAFDEAHIRSLVNLGLSDKAEMGRDRKTIGYKGIGFTSVFEVTETPQVITREFAFAFDRHQAWETVRQYFDIDVAMVPVRSFPFRISDEAWSADRRVVRKLLADGAVTVIRLPLKSTDLRERVAESLVASLPAELLLFSPHLEELTIRRAGIEDVSWRRIAKRRHAGGELLTLRSPKETRKWLVARGTTPIAERLITQLDDRLWRDVTELSFAVALPWKRRVDSTLSQQSIHVYYPTDDVIDRGVLVHGDFYVSSDRRRIEASGTGGQISKAVARAAAEALACLAESVAETQGADLLRTLAPRGSSSGFGRHLSSALDTALKKARIVRLAAGGLASPSEVTIFDGSRLSDEGRSEFARMFGPQDGLMRVADVDTIVLDYLISLDAYRLAPSRAVVRLQRLPVTRYGKRVAALAEWLAVLRSERQALASVIDGLRARPILVDTSGAQVAPGDAVLRIADIPRLPTRVEKREVKPLRSQAAARFFADMRVTELSLESAVEMVVGAMKSRYYVDEAEAKEILAFLWGIWRKSRRVLETAKGLDGVRVPARTATGQSVKWVPARDTYFTKAWLGNDNLERLYGPFDDHEFLALSPPPRGVRSEREFLSLLGVSEKPTLKQIKHAWSEYPGNSYSGREWRWAVDPENEGACTDHPRSQVGRFAYVDRLGEILAEDLTIHRATALAVLLAETGEPFGGDAVIECAASAHDSRPRPRKRVEGFQHWLLDRHEWIPAKTQEGTTILTSPEGAWRDVARAYSDYAIPRTSLPASVAQALHLPSPSAPTLGALQHLISQLYDNHPGLADAPANVRKTALWAQQQLDRLVRTQTPRSLNVPLVARTDGALVWSFKPWVPDAPGAHDIPGLPLIEGRCSNLQRVYRLRSAREDLEISVEPSRPLRKQPYLDKWVKAALLAFLDARGVDRDQTAARLARLDDAPLETLRLRVTYDGRSVNVNRETYVQIRRNRNGAVIGGTLYRTGADSLNPLSLADELALYLGDSSLADPIALLLSNREHVLVRYRITDDDLNLAGGILADALRRAGRDDTESEPAEDVSETPEEQEPHGSHEAGAGEPEQAHEDGAEPAPGGSTSGNGRIEASRIRERLGSLPQRPTHTRNGSALPLDKVAFGAPTEPTAQERQERAQQQQRRERTSLGTPASGSGATGGGFIDSDPEVEAEAIDVIKRYAHEFGAVDVIDVQSEKRGWDLEFIMGDGRILPVEVKGSRSDTAFVITRREREAAALDEYLLLWVVNLRNPHAAGIRRFRAPGKQLTDKDLRTISWIVERWHRLDYDEVPISLTDHDSASGDTTR